jgi:hypothetical protein
VTGTANLQLARDGGPNMPQMERGGTQNMKTILMGLAMAYGVALGLALQDISLGLTLGVMLGAVATSNAVRTQSANA